MTQRDPDYGPSGYLPERAARRARKIVLRAPLGLQWVLAAAAVGLVLLVVVIVFAWRASQPPGEPFVSAGPVEEIGTASHDGDRGVLYVAAAGRVRAFAVGRTGVPVYCERSGRLESPAGRVWSATGRALDGGASLDTYPVVVHRGVVYVDLTRRQPGPPPEDRGVEATCF
ncbi:MAG: hypothetical protein KY462_16190 [Actinobacteria bacterium]|nr:hypothetical protein [Actinomycetota bacterium]